MNIVVGILRMLYLEVASSLLSTSTFPITAFSLYSSANWSMIGPTILHGPHHSAQKSITTSLSVLRTSSKVASVISRAIIILF